VFELLGSRVERPASLPAPIADYCHVTEGHNPHLLTEVFYFIAQCPHTYKQVAQLSQRDRAAGWVSYGQKWKTVTAKQYSTDIIGLSSTTMT